MLRRMRQEQISEVPPEVVPEPKPAGREASVARELPPAPWGFLRYRDKAEPVFAIDRNPWRIGRSKGNDLILRDLSVSRRHAEILLLEDGGLELVDLESLNGVFVNDDRVSRIRLRDGDRVDIGDVRLHFTLKDPG
ncbi:MAG: FHA domain-containing protein [Gammaproteobacteria bacterium]|nr:MAG: FHA domain-containing protein [Gammaproteobacteria bacterium]